MEAKIRELMHRLANILENLVGFLMLGALFVALIGLVCMVSPIDLLGDPMVFSKYLSIASTIVIGVEFVKMLCTHTINSVIEIMLLAVARQMITEHTSPLENLFACISIAVLYLVRKFLYVKQLDKFNRVKLFEFLPWQKFAKKKKKENNMSLPNDPIMLLSVINTMLRDRYNSLDALCEGEDLAKNALEHRLATVGYKYMPETNQFR